MINRRHFLQFTGSAIATLGFSHLDITQQGNRYAQIVAQSTPRKLALLVGINKYPTNKRSFQNLRGCVTDVKLQEELLVHSFGFNRKDIIKLTTDSPPDYQPTRKNILKQFEEHLINQAKPGDVVVFHFSGHGSFLRDPNPIKNCNTQKFDELNSTLVVTDEGQNNLAPDIMGRTLFLLRSALKTDNVTMVLDSCYSGGGTRGNFIVRSVPGDNLEPLPEELAYQQRWMKQLRLNEEELRQRRCAGVGKGVVIASAEKGKEAADAKFDGFDAGAFTYFLTQYLWQQKNTVGGTIAEIRNIKPLSFQIPVVDGDESKPIYFISSKQTASSDAVISKVEGEKITLWLGGVDYDGLTAFQRGATFAVVDNSRKASGKLELTSPRSGLVAEAKLVEKATNISLQPGTLLQESSRVIPADLKLTIGLDSSLAGEASTAQAALSKINRIQAVPAKQGNSPYPSEVQYILSRMTADYRQLQKQGNIPAVGSIGLFTQGLELVSQSFGQPGETITAAVSRLEAKIKSLLATFIIKKTLNTNSSQLDVEVVLNLVEQPNKVLARTATLQGKNNSAQSIQVYPNRLPLNKLFQFQVTNNTNDNLYVAILLVDSSGDLLVVFPYRKNINNNTLLLKPSATLIAGQRGQMELQAVEKGSAEALVIVSRSPLKKAVKALQSLVVEQNRGSEAIDISREPVEVISDLLDDLSGERGISVEYKEVKVADIATLSISFAVG
ncbi:caspase family protein [Iningainema tapete]|nr:caspase family protein [Iningainema tapete]